MGYSYLILLKKKTGDDDITVTTYNIPVVCVDLGIGPFGQELDVKPRHKINLTSRHNGHLDMQDYGDGIPWPPEAFRTFREFSLWQKVRYCLNRLIGRKIQFRKPEFPTSEFFYYLIVKDITMEERESLLKLEDVSEIPTHPKYRKLVPHLFEGE